MAECGSNTYMHLMTSKSLKQQTPEQLARLEKQRAAKIEGAIALAEVEKESVAIRENMERLRALRLAKEAEDALKPPVIAEKKTAPKKPVKVAQSAPETVGE